MPSGKDYPGYKNGGVFPANQTSSVNERTGKVLRRFLTRGTADAGMVIPDDLE